VPSAKPSSSEIAAMRKKRRLYFDDDEYQQACGLARSALMAGALDLERLVRFGQQLAGLGTLSDSWPANALIAATQAMGAAGTISEADQAALLSLMGSFYLLQGDEADGAASFLAERYALFGDSYACIFDRPVVPDITDKFVAFTGPCSAGSRRACFDMVRARGGVPSDVTWYTDYLFVSEQHLEARVISSKMLDAVVVRARFGRIRVLPESAFPASFDVE